MAIERLASSIGLRVSPIKSILFFLFFWLFLFVVLAQFLCFQTLLCLQILVGFHFLLLPQILLFYTFWGFFLQIDDSKFFAVLEIQAIVFAVLSENAVLNFECRLLDLYFRL